MSPNIFSHMTWAASMNTLDYTPHHNAVGVRIHNINLAQPLLPSQTREIQRLLYQYKLVIFEDQQLEDVQICAFAHRFGPPFISSRNNPVLGGAEQLPDVVIIGNRADEYQQAFLGHQEVLPHSDHQWLRCPSAISLLYAIDIEQGASPTTWIDMAAAYNLLNNETKTKIDGLHLITYNPFHRPFGSVQARYVNSRRETVPGNVYPHPLVRTHPLTGQRVLYLNAAYEMELVGLDYDSGTTLIEQLHTHMATVPCKYEHPWKNGDLILWDNQATVHYRPAFQPEVRRVLKRVSVGGSAPY